MKFKQFKKTLQASARFEINDQHKEIPLDDYLVAREKPSLKVFVPRLLMTLSILVFAAVLSFYIYWSSTPMTTLTIDINPSLVVELNGFDKVISVRGVDPSSEVFATSLDILHKSPEVMLEKIQQAATTRGFIDGTEGYALIGIYGKDKDAEAKIKASLDAVQTMDLLTIMQHDFTSFTLSYKVYEGSIPSGSTGATPDTTYGSSPDTWPSEGNVDSSDNTVISIYDWQWIQSYAASHDISQTKLVLAIDIFNRSDLYTTATDMETLIYTNIDDLLAIYQSLEN